MVNPNDRNVLFVGGPLHGKVFARVGVRGAGPMVVAVPVTDIRYPEPHSLDDTFAIKTHTYTPDRFGVAGCDDALNLKVSEDVRENRPTLMMEALKLALAKAVNR